MRCIEIHSLTPFPPTLLNRDRNGMAKTAIIGGEDRNRLSSQCIKRHWKDSQVMQAAISRLALDKTVQSRLIFRDEIVRPLLLKADGTLSVTNDQASAFIGWLSGCVEAVVNGAGQTSDITKAAAATEKASAAILADANRGVAVLMADNTLVKDGGCAIKNPISWGRHEIAAVLAVATTALAAIVAGTKPNVAEIRKAVAAELEKQSVRVVGGVFAALFGRMDTGSIVGHVDSTVEVAHAITVHAAQSTVDFLTAVDESPYADRSSIGAATMQDTELTSGLYYHHTTILWDDLLNNLGLQQAQAIANPDDRAATTANIMAQAKALVSALVTCAVTTHPDAKRGSTDTRTVASFTLVNKTSMPLTLAEAFNPAITGVDHLGASLQAMAALEQARDVALNRDPAAAQKRWLLTVPSPATVTPASMAVLGQDAGSLQALVAWAAE